MISYLALPIIACIYILAGSGYAKLINGPIVEKIGLRFLLGGGLATLVWFILYRFGFAFTMFSFFSASAIVLCIGLFLVKFLGSKGNVSQVALTSRIDKILFWAIIILSVCHILITTYNPITSWDSMALYDFAGRIAGQSGNLNHLTTSTYYMSYPLHVSLSHAVLYIFGAVNPQGIHSLILISFVAVIFGRLYSWTNTRYALLGALLTISSYQIFYHASYAYTNIPYVSFLIIGYLFAVSGHKKSESRGYLLLGGISLGLSTWTRSSEPFWLVGILLLLWQSWKTKQIASGVIGIISLLSIRLAWTSFYSATLSTLNIAPAEDGFALNLATFQMIVSNYAPITWYILLNIIHPYLLAWLLFIPSVVIAIYKKNHRLWQLLLASILIFAMVIGAIAVFSTYYTSWNEIGDSARRMMLFIIPLSTVTSVYALYLCNHQEGND
jgi:hypothetical protein